MGMFSGAVNTAVIVDVYEKEVLGAASSDGGWSFKSVDLLGISHNLKAIPLALI